MQLDLSRHTFNENSGIHCGNEPNSSVDNLLGSFTSGCASFNDESSAERVRHARLDAGCCDLLADLAGVQSL